MPDWLWKLLGKNPCAVVAYFGDDVEPLTKELRPLELSREHITDPRLLRGKRVGLAVFRLGGGGFWRAFRHAPHKLLAFNERGERHHLRLDIASLLFCRGVELDRIWLRPWWWPWAKERSKQSKQSTTLAGRALTEGRPRIAIVAPYFPWPLGHGGAVRIYSLLKEAAKEFDIFLYCFAEDGTTFGPVMDFVHQAVLFEMPRYREPRWASVDPPEVREFRSPALRERLAEDRALFAFALVQAEYTHLAPYTNDLVTAHDVTYDLYAQIHAREQSLSSWWNLWRWRRFERGIKARSIVMAEKDAPLLSDTTIIPNGVNLARFNPTPEGDGSRVLFIGSFRHFPNVTAFRFLAEQVWPLVKDAQLEVVAGPDHTRFYDPPAMPNVTIHGFLADVVPLYQRANIVVSPTLVSAGTNLKVLEAMAMERAIVSTTSGCAGLHLEHGKSVLIADAAEAFAAAIKSLLQDAAQRKALAERARTTAEARFDWRAIGKQQAALWRKFIR
ncbi:MAG: glycosyltransferase [Acidobacteria bacterium]|nr:glycosyltransferase [Acidobacteriota bacterium]